MVSIYASVLIALATVLPAPSDRGLKPNILLIIGDDIGVDRVAVYGEHPAPGRTPNLDALAAQGMLFRNVWSYDTCSPTRAAMLTGRHARRTGIGTFILTSNASYDLSVTETSLADILAAEGYRTAAIGKWHLSAKLSATDWLTHPLQMGFEHHWGPITNFVISDTYYNFQKNIDGTVIQQAKYATTDQVDDTLTMIETFDQEPWFIWLAFNAPHKPLHVPPAHLHSYQLGDELPGVSPGSTAAVGRPQGTAAFPGPSGSASPWGPLPSPLPIIPTDPEHDGPLYVKAMAEAMDTEIGRLLASMDPVTRANTYVIFVGDNGTNGPAISPPWDPAKGKSTVYEGGINVPLIITGPSVMPAQESPALLHVVDLFATIAELAGANALTGEDSTSFALHLSVPTARTPQIVYGERFWPNGFVPHEIYQQVARKGNYKYMRFYNPSGALVIQDLYDLQADPFETNDLLNGPLDGAAMAAFVDLAAYMDALD